METAYLWRTHAWQREPPYARDTVFSRFFALANPRLSMCLIPAKGKWQSPQCTPLRIFLIYCAAYRPPGNVREKNENMDRVRFRSWTRKVPTPRQPIHNSTKRARRVVLVGHGRGTRKRDAPVRRTKSKKAHAAAQVHKNAPGVLMVFTRLLLVRYACRRVRVTL